MQAPVTDADLPMRNIAHASRRARALLYVQAGFALLAMTMLIGLDAGGASAPLTGPAHLMVAIFHPILFIVAGLSVLRWIYLANAISHVMGAQGMMSPALAVGSYFIPIANLGMPCQSMREIWKASTNPRDWEAVRAPALIGWWWFFWLLAIIVGSIGNLLESGRVPLEGAERTGMALAIVSDLLLIPASLLLARIIGQITAKLEAVTA